MRGSLRPFGASGPLTLKSCLLAVFAYLRVNGLREDYEAGIFMVARSRNEDIRMDAFCLTKVVFLMEARLSVVFRAYVSIDFFNPRSSDY